ncbi:MAG: c-type cytochrome [Chloroflexota bacterium]
MAFVFGALVVGLSGLLLLIGARSPYTHGNLQPRFDAAYVRTEQVLVGEVAAYGGLGNSLVVRMRDDPAAWGARLFVVKGCAGCHALGGTGAAVGPQLTRLTLSVLEKSTRRGPAGMPSYSRDALGDEELLAIIGYLRALREAARPPTVAGEGFRDAVAPLLRQQCMSCHSLNGKAGFSVVDRDSILRGGESGPAVVPWDAEASLLIQKLRPSPAIGERMPPDEPPLD